MDDANTLVDGYLSSEAGVDSGFAPSLLPENQWSWAVNTTFRGGFPKPRPGYQFRQLMFSSGLDQTNFTDGLFQGRGSYIDDNRNAFLMASISGRIFTVSVADFSVRDITIPGNPSDISAPHAWFQQAESTTIVQNKINAPFLWNGISARRSDVNTEVPVGGPMAYAGRLWVARDNLFFGGDLAYSHVPPSRDDVISFTENTYLNEGGAFAVERMITGLTFGQNIDSTLGVKDLLIFEEDTVHAFDAPADRATWKDLQRPIERFALLGQGSLSHEGIVNLNSDTIFRSLTGINSFKYARSAFSDWGNTPISRQVTRGLASDTQQRLNKTSAVNFENRMLMTILPEKINGRGVIHRGLVALDYDLVSGMGRKLNPAWEGVWTGLKILSIQTITHKSSKRCFIFALSDDSKIELWEVTKEARFDVGQTGEDTRIKWVLESKSFTFGRPRAMKRLESSETWYNQLTGQIDATYRFRSNLSDCWTPWATQTDCAKYKDCATVIDGCNVVRYLRSQSRGRLGLPIPPDVIDPQSGRYTNQGYEHQLRIELHGYAVLNRVMMTSNLTGDLSVPDIRGAGCIEVGPGACKTGDCVELECCDPDDFSYSIPSSLTQLAFIRGTVYLNTPSVPGSVPFPSIVITLYNNPIGLPVAEANSGLDGTYGFDNIYPGSYVIKVTIPAGYVIDPSSSETINRVLAAGYTSVGNDFYLLGPPAPVLEKVQIDGLGMAVLAEQGSLSVQVDGLGMAVVAEQGSQEVQIDGLGLAVGTQQGVDAVQLDGLSLVVIGFVDPPAPPPLPTPPLDTYPSAAAAYSVRLLRTAYVGQCLRIRRSSDNTEQDIGFSSGALDTTALLAFCGAGNGFVAKWYDQSGNGNDAVMASAGTQPQLVSSGSLIIVSSLPAVQFGTGIRLDLTTPLSGTPNWAIESVWNTPSNIQPLSVKSDGRPCVRSDLSFYLYVQTDSHYSSYSGFTLRAVGTFVATSSLEKYYENGSARTASSSHNAIAGSPNFESIGSNTVSFNHFGTLQEVIFWAADQSSNALLINANANSYFAIY